MPPGLRFLRCLSVLAGLSAAGCTAHGDFGDAPDGGPTGYPPGFAQTGHFQTTPGSGGAVARNTKGGVLGHGASAERDTSDPGDPDGIPNLDPVNTDSDDGALDFVLQLSSVPPPARTAFMISAPEGGKGGRYYLNVLVDLNMDGRWGGNAGPDLPEWTVRNLAVTVAPGTGATVRPPLFYYGNGSALPERSWMRIALTRQPVAGTDWSGGGSYSAGEIEDYPVELPKAAGKCAPIVVMQCPQRVDFAGAGTATFACTLTNLRSCPGTAQYSMTRHDGGVALRSADGHGRDFTAAGPLPIGAAPGPAADNPLSVAFTAIRGGPLPSRWGYRAWTADPQAQIKPRSITLGYGDSVGEIEFADGEAPAP